MKLWNPVFLDFKELNNNSKYLLNDLINGNISCVIIKNVLSKNECNLITTILDKSNAFNLNLGQSQGRFGITIDTANKFGNLRVNSKNYWVKMKEFNQKYDSLFNKNNDLSSIMFDIIKTIIYPEVEYMQNNDIKSRGAFLKLNTGNLSLHNDGFNYGKIIDFPNIDREQYPLIMDKAAVDTNGVMSCVFIIQQPVNSVNIELYNCLIDDIEHLSKELDMYSHFAGVKFKNQKLLQKIVNTKPRYRPIIETGDMYIFSASRIHNVINNNKDRLTFTLFGYYNKLINKLIVCH